MPDLKNIYKAYGDVNVFIDFSISFRKNWINCILGPSGCGKTTLLNIIAGLTRPDSGTIENVNLEKISYVFQDPRLLPWKTVCENIEFTLKKKNSVETARKVAQKYIKLMELEGYGDFYPGQLSGGMKQRVSLARAFSFPSDLILMDEPFKGLDYKLKQNLQKSFSDLWEQDKRTVIYVTHDIEEALELGQEIHLFSKHPVRILKTFQKKDFIVNGKDNKLITDLME